MQTKPIVIFIQLIQSCYLAIYTDMMSGFMCYILHLCIIIYTLEKYESTHSHTVLQADSVDVEAERQGYEFPVAGEVVGLDTANGSEATITIPQELLLARANGILKDSSYGSYV